jgi:hypothetical protein
VSHCAWAAMLLSSRPGELVEVKMLQADPGARVPGLGQALLRMAVYSRITFLCSGNRGLWLAGFWDSWLTMSGLMSIKATA